MSSKARKGRVVLRLTCLEGSIPAYREQRSSTKSTTSGALTSKSRRKIASEQLVTAAQLRVRCCSSSCKEPSKRRVGSTLPCAGSGSRGPCLLPPQLSLGAAMSCVRACAAGGLRCGSRWLVNSFSNSFSCLLAVD